MGNEGKIPSFCGKKWPQGQSICPHLFSVKNLKYTELYLMAFSSLRLVLCVHSFCAIRKHCSLLMHIYIRLLIAVLLFQWSFGKLTLKEMETPMKTVLVNMGDQLAMRGQ